MRIAKRQLRRIIREEKAKIQEQSRALGLYASISHVEQIKSELNNLYGQIEEDAMLDGLEEGEAEDAAGEAIMQLVKEFLGGMGHYGDVSYTHGDKRWMIK